MKNGASRRKEIPINEPTGTMSYTAGIANVYYKEHVYIVRCGYGEDDIEPLCRQLSDSEREHFESENRHRPEVMGPQRALSPQEIGQPPFTTLQTLLEHERDLHLCTSYINGRGKNPEGFAFFDPATNPAARAKTATKIEFFLARPDLSPIASEAIDKTMARSPFVLKPEEEAIFRQRWPRFFGIIKSQLQILAEKEQVRKNVDNAVLQAAPEERTA